MRAVVQRVRSAHVEVDGRTVGACGPGLLVLLGVARGDGLAEADWLAARIAGLRVFPDDQDRMNLSLLDTSREALVVSQFTLLADCRKGRRPSFVRAAPPEEAERLYEAFCDRLAGHGVRVSRGVFRAMMQVHLVNDGPVTLVIDTPERPA